MRSAPAPRHPVRPSLAIAAAILASATLAACVVVGATPSPDIPRGLAASPAATVPPTAGPSPLASPVPSAVAPDSLLDPRVDGLDVVVGESAIALEATVIRPGHVTLVVHNAGSVARRLELRPDGSGRGDGGDRQKIETRTFGPGETLRVEAELAPGVYEIECHFANRDGRTLKAYLEVKADAPLPTADPGQEQLGIVRIVQFAFVPGTLDVPVGTEVRWLNEDPAPHTVTAEDGSFDSRQLDPGASFTFVVRAPGVFRYHCEIHPTMVGEIRAR